MKKYLYLLFLLLSSEIYGQITLPTIKANFGVDGDLKANFFNNSVLTNNDDDDWFNYNNSQTGVGVIDTSGASGIVVRYTSDPAFRTLSFQRNMGMPSFSIVNNKLLIDAIFIRDYHGSDSTMFASGASKNGMSPGDWSCPIAQAVPNKNDILDVTAHVRRDGPNNTDSLWMFGGVSIESTSGDRYFDFEMYQTDLYYDKSTQKFSGYGSDAGHTSWKFDASGNVISAGDIIFSADYGNSTLTSIEARIWADKSSLSITPIGFNWSGSFDGASSGSQFGYAGIKPKSGTFYSGIENDDTTWAGPFSLIRADNTVATNYVSGQFMEFSVNLTKLGLDPITLLSNAGCTLPFKKIMVKSRASTSFTAQLKDFVGPVNFFQASMVKVKADFSLSCGIMGPTEITVKNPVSTSVYTWSTINGHIMGDTTGNYIMVDSAGTYFVRQQLQSGCLTYATDTIVVPPRNKSCFVMETNLVSFSGKIINKKTQLNWAVLQNKVIKYFEIESSADGVYFISLNKIDSYSSNLPIADYNFIDGRYELSTSIFYRLKIVSFGNNISYSRIIQISTGNIEGMKARIMPNPVKDVMQVNIFSLVDKTVEISIYNSTGFLMKRIQANIQKGNMQLTFSDFNNWPNGIYIFKLNSDNDTIIKKMVLKK